jgi:hypothetical protein
MGNEIDREKLLLLNALYSLLDGLGAMTNTNELSGRGIGFDDMNDILEARELILVAKQQGIL